VVDPSSNEIELFSGTIEVETFRIHEVSIPRRGEFEVRLTELSPQGAGTVGLQWGPLANGLCGTVVYQETLVALLNFPELAGPVTPGSYCVSIYDNGSLTQTMTYTIRVSHP
jgi:hypothetical protein